MTSLSAPETTADPADRLAEFIERIDECRGTTYATHGLHPYPAKFIPHIPKEVIRAYSQPGDRVWDPMCGSGTAVVEAALAGRDGIGGDLNPIATLVSKAKTTPLEPAAAAELRELAAALSALALVAEELPAEPPEFPNRDHWFEPQVSRELAYALARIEGLESEAAEQLAKCAFSAVLVSVSNQESETRWSAKRQDAVPGGALRKLAKRIVDSVAQVDEFAAAASGSAEIRSEDARLTGLPEDSVQLVVTSPPYANSHDYYLYNKLRMFWLGYEVAPVQEAEIGSRNRHSDRKEGVETYLDAMEAVLAQIGRVLEPGGRAVVVVADAVIRKELFAMDRLISDRASRVGLRGERGFRFEHRRFNSTFQRGFGTSHAKQTHVLVFAHE